MTLITRTVSALAASVISALIAAGAYAEATRIPDQP
jgi:hypothetical protein